MERNLPAEREQRGYAASNTVVGSKNDAKTRCNGCRAPDYLVSLERRWSGRQDSNLRPSAPKADALPDCATPRRVVCPRLWSAKAQGWRWFDLPCPHFRADRISSRDLTAGCSNSVSHAAGRRRCQFGCSWVVPGRFGCSASASRSSIGTMTSMAGVRAT